jgi:hypothetical protein
MSGHRENYGFLRSQYTSNVIDVNTPLQSFADKASPYAGYVQML